MLRHDLKKNEKQGFDGVRFETCFLLFKQKSNGKLLFSYFSLLFHSLVMKQECVAEETKTAFLVTKPFETLNFSSPRTLRAVTSYSGH